MSVNLIPQDELTLDLLAEVLAKMYWYSLNSGGNTPTDVEEPGTCAAGADLGDQRQSHSTAERVLAQAEVAP